MLPLTLAFLLALAASLATRLYLNTRQLAHVEQHRGAVPAEFAKAIDLPTHQKAADYTVTAGRAGRVRMIVSVALLLTWTLGGGLAFFDAFWKTRIDGEVMRGIAFLWSVLGVAALLALPFSIHRTFKIEQRFGFNRTTPALFVKDLLKSVLLGLVLGTPLMAAALWLMESAGALWWLWVWAVWTAFSLFLTWILPTYLLPIFNKLTPLRDGTLKDRLTALLARVEFPNQGLFVMDGSRRSAHSNAFFAGLGSSRRIVLYDTLIEQMGEPEIEAVLAHELGHAKLRHVLKMTLMSIAQSLIGLAILGWLSQHDWFYKGLGLNEPSSHGALLLFLWVVPVFLFFTAPIGSWLSRRYEYEADDYGKAHSEPGSLAAALLAIYRHNAATLTPDPVHSAFYDSHPPAALRIPRLLR
ncbi:MAG: M48 family metallopeptidase [Planctomycetota bacterium]